MTMKYQALVKQVQAEVANHIDEITELETYTERSEYVTDEIVEEFIPNLDEVLVIASKNQILMYESEKSSYAKMGDYDNVFDFLSQRLSEELLDEAIQEYRKLA